MFIRITYALISVLKNVKILFIKKYFKAIKLSVNGGHAHICKRYKEWHSNWEFVLCSIVSIVHSSRGIPNVVGSSESQSPLLLKVSSSQMVSLFSEKSSFELGLLQCWFCKRVLETVGSYALRQLLLGMRILASAGPLLLLSSHRTTDPRH